MGGLFSSCSTTEKEKVSNEGQKQPTQGYNPPQHQSATNTKVERSINEKDKAILELKKARDKLTKLQKKFDADCIKLETQAKEMLKNGRKDRALLSLKLKKHKQKELESMDGKMLTLMKMINDIEWEAHNIEVLNALKAGTAELNRLHEEMPLEKVQLLLEESNEAIEIENQISQALAGAGLNEIDDAELEAEYDRMFGRDIIEEKIDQAKINVPNQQLEVELPDVPDHQPLPDVPNHVPIVDEVVEEADIRVAV